MTKGSSNIAYGFLNPNTVRIWVGGWVGFGALVRINPLSADFKFTMI